MTEPEMYPSTDYPTFEEEFESFDELRENVESTIEGLNFIVSWIRGWDGEETDSDYGTWFYILIFMPRKTQTIQWEVKNVNTDQVDQWLLEYVKPRTMRWYGW